MVTLGSTEARALEDAARTRNIDLSIHRIAKGSEIADAIEMAHASGATALNVFASPMLFGNGRLIMERVAALRLPAMYQWPEMAEEGGFAAYGPRIPYIRVLAARLTVKILQGVKPADIPIEQPTKFELVINLKTANAVGYRAPGIIAASGQADRISPVTSAHGPLRRFQDVRFPVGGRADVPPPKRKFRVNRVSAAVVEGNFGRVDNVMTVELACPDQKLTMCRRVRLCATWPMVVNYLW